MYQKSQKRGERVELTNQRVSPGHEEQLEFQVSYPIPAEPGNYPTGDWKLFPGEIEEERS